jgi:hypothetical protein
MEPTHQAIGWGRHSMTFGRRPKMSDGSLSGECWTGKYLEGNDCGIIDVPSRYSSGDDWGKPLQTSVCRTGISAGIRTHHVPNTSLSQPVQKYQRQKLCCFIKGVEHADSLLRNPPELVYHSTFQVSEHDAKFVSKHSYLVLQFVLSLLLVHVVLLSSDDNTCNNGLICDNETHTCITTHLPGPRPGTVSARTISTVLLDGSQSCNCFHVTHEISRV